MHPLFQSIQLKEELHVKVETFCQQWDNGLPISIFTSGSTGKPKEIAFTKEQFIQSAKKTIAFFDLNENTRIKKELLNFFIPKYRLHSKNNSLFFS
jgi:acyl-coenzyme A synthetase/AMP-(fatty) acid ligase